MCSTSCNIDASETIVADEDDVYSIKGVTGLMFRGVTMETSAVTPTPSLIEVGSQLSEALSAAGLSTVCNDY